MRLLSVLMPACLTLHAQDAVDAYLRSQMARSHIPGLAVAVIRGGRVEKLAAYGQASLELGVPVTVDSAFQTASATKLYTSVLMMRLVEEGKLDLDAPLSRYLGPVPEAWRSITVRHLAAHASGMKPGAGAPATDRPEDVLGAALAQPLAAEPGRLAAYGSLDYSVLALVLERAAGRPYPELVRERVWKPLGLGATAFEDAQDPMPDLRTAEVLAGRVPVYQWQGDRQRAFWFRYPAHAYAAGGAYSSARDLAAFLLAVDAGAVLPPGLRQEMWTPYRLNDGTPGGFGVGWTTGTLGGRFCVGHSGGPALSDILYFPGERLGIIVLTNQQRLHPSLARGLAARLLPPGPLAAAPLPSDPDPELTARHRRLLEGMASGRAEAGAFAGEAAGALPACLPWLESQVGAYPPLGRFGFLSVRVEGARTVREYRAFHGPAATLRWRFVSEGGKVVDFDVFEE